MGDEPHRPYNRPPLSKQVLTGEWEPDRTALPAGVDDTLDVDWELGVTATGLDLAGQVVRLDDGRELFYDGLVIATGATPRRLPGTDDLAGVFTLRTLDDALAIRAAIDDGARRVVVVGAGSSAPRWRRRAGSATSTSPWSNRCRSRSPGCWASGVGSVIADLHRSHGVDVRLGVGVDSVEGDGRVERVVLADGSTVDADLVVVGIGVVPNTGWLEGSGLTLDDGVVCDETTLVAPGIVAAGDVARWPNGRCSTRRCGSSTGSTRSTWPTTRQAPPGRGRRRRRSRRLPLPARPVVLERPVRPQDPTRRPPGARRRTGHHRR